MASPGHKRAARSPKPVEGSGNNVMAELQERLKGRKEPRVDPGYTPMKPIGRAKSDKVPLSIQQQSGGLSGRTRWHIKPPSYGEPEHPFSSSVSAYQIGSTSKASSPDRSYVRGNLPPPPKTPPPILANRIRSSNSGGDLPKSAIGKSLSSKPTATNEKKEVSSSLSLEVEGAGHHSTAVRKERLESTEAPPDSPKSVGGGGVKGLAKLFNEREGEGKKSDQLNKAASEPKDIGMGNPEGGRKEGSVPSSESLGRGRRVPGGSSSSESELTSSTDSTRSYQNIFDDEAFAHFDRRPKQSRRRDKKPKPLPRKSSISTLTLTSTSMRAMNDPVTEETRDARLKTESTSQWEACEKPVGAPEKAAVTTHAEDNCQLDSTPAIIVNNPFVDLETEIDLLVDITNLPSRLSQLTSSPDPTERVAGSRVHPKTELNKALSHNPSGIIPIVRRNSPQAKRELRNGVCSEGDQDDSETEDDYIPMDAIPYSELTATLRKNLPSSSVPIDPRSSAYYLKILPSDPLPPSPNSPKEAPKSPGDTYIKMGELKTETEMAHSREVTDSEQHRIRENSPSISMGKPLGVRVGSSSPFHRVDYSEVMVQGQASSSQESGIPVQNITRGEPQPQSSTGTKSQLQYKEVLVKGNTNKPENPQSSDNMEAQAHTVVKAPTTPEQGGVTAEPPKFADRPLPPRPLENPYYNTLEDSTVSPLTVPKSGAVWHEYVEIDDDGIDKMAVATNQESVTATPMPRRLSQPQKQMIRIEAPPEVPERPDNLDSMADDSGDYSYAAVPGQSLFGLQWMRFHARSTAGQSPFPLHFPSQSNPGPYSPAPHIAKKKGSPPRHVDATAANSRPPTLPPKTESLLREVSLIPAYVDGIPSPYITPVRMKQRKMSAPEVFNLSTTRLPLPRGSAPRRETSADSSQLSIPFAKRRQIPLPPRPKVPPSNTHRGLQRARPVPEPNPTPSLSKSIVGEVHQVHGDLRKGGHQPLSRQRSQSSGEISIKRTALRQSKSYTPVHPSTPTQSHRERPPDLPPRIQWRKRTGVRNKIDRRSLAIIMQNKEAISRQLSKSSEAERQVNPEADGNPSMIRNLGDILLELDTLLRHKLYTERDLISAIEQQLKIKLQAVENAEYSSDGASPTHGDAPNGATVSSPERKLSSSPTTVQITDQDVDNVVSYMKANQLGSPEERSLSDSPQSLHKPRSDTVIILCDDRSSSDSRESSKSPDEETRRLASVVRTRSNSNPSLDAPSMRGIRSLSAGNRALQRVNAKRRPSAAVEECLTGQNATTYNNGTGVFTHKGGTLMNVASGVEIEIPEGAISKGKKQRVWFEVLQPVYDLSREDEVAQPLIESHQPAASGFSGLESHLRDKQERWIQLTPIVLVGPCDAVFQKPIKIKIPHCLPYRNNSWHLHLLARAQNSKSEDWLELPNSSGLIIPFKKRKPKFFRSTTYQMHLHYGMVRTKQLGTFKLIGTPVGKGAYAAKKMVASVYTRTEEKASEKSFSLEVFMANSIFDQVQTLHQVLVGNGYECLEMNIPILCFGDGRDMELTLSSDTNATTPLATKTISFGQFWRLKQVGQPRVQFDVDKKALDSSRTLTLKIQQAGAKFSHETNFIIP